MIEIKNLRKIYERTEVLNIPDLTFKKEKLSGLLGIMVQEKRLYLA